MNLKKLSLAALSLTLAAGLLVGCAGKASNVPTPTTKPSPSAPAPTPDAGAGVKTGLSVITDISSSKAPEADKDGTAQSNIALVAVTVGDDGVIDSCVIDTIQAKITFNAKGEVTSDLSMEVPSKNELGENYGMKKASSIGKEWNEQAAAFAAWAVGKTVDEVKGLPLNDKGATTDPDLVSSATIGMTGFMEGIDAAVKNASHLGAQKGDVLSLTTSTNIAKSKNATADAEGQAQAYATVAAVTRNGDTVTSCYIDAVQPTVKFDAAGVISTDLTAPVASKNQLGETYGMKKVSAIGKEWNEQAAAFATYVTGKTVSEVAGIAVNDKGGAADADLASSCSIGIGEFQALIAKTGN